MVFNFLGMRTRRYGGQKRKAKKEARKVATIQYVKRAIDRSIEDKFVYLNNALMGGANLTNATPQVNLLNGLAQGTTDQTRTGDKVRFARLKLDLLVSAPISATGNSTAYKFDIIRYKNPRGVAPTITNLYGVATPAAIDHFNDVSIDWKSRYECLASRSFVINYPAATVAQVQLLSFDINLNDVQTDYSLGNVGTIADIDKNALYLVAHQDTALSTSVYFAYYLWYQDM